MFLEKLKRNRIYILPGIFVLLYLLYLIYSWQFASSFSGNQYFVELARSFLQGKLYLLDPNLTFDVVPFQGHNYLPFGFLPSIIIIPWYALFPAAIRQEYIILFFALLDIFLLWKIASKQFNVSVLDAWILAVGLLLGTNVIFLLFYGDLTHYYSQYIAFSMVLLSVYFYWIHKNPFWTGVFLAFAFLTRLNLLFIALFYGLDILFEFSQKERYKKLLSFFIPIALGLFLYLLYNYLRFGDVFESGYTFQNIVNPIIKNDQLYGIFNIKYILTNLYFFFFQGPEMTFALGSKVAVAPYLSPNAWGMGIIFTSPILLFAFHLPSLQKYRRQFLLLLIVFLLNLSVIFSYYGIGVRQYGYRYAVDLFPLLFIMLFMNTPKHIKLFWIILLLCSIGFNMYMNMQILQVPL